MNEDVLTKTIITTYQHFYRSITYDSLYTLPLNDQNTHSIENFIQYLRHKHGNAQIGSYFILDFMEISFAWWYKRKGLKYGMQSIKLSWIIGKKSIERFESINRDPYKVTYYSNLFAADVKHGIRSKVNKINSKTKGAIIALFELNDREEAEKQRFYNTIEGLFWCAANTTLYNPKSKLCQDCLNKTACKAIQLERLPKLYKLRNGERNKPEPQRVTGRFFT